MNYGVVEMLCAMMHKSRSQMIPALLSAEPIADHAAVVIHGHLPATACNGFSYRAFCDIIDKIYMPLCVFPGYAQIATYNELIYLLGHLGHLPFMSLISLDLLKALNHTPSTYFTSEEESKFLAMLSGLSDLIHMLIDARYEFL
jgi:hypothetical protein